MKVAIDSTPLTVPSGGIPRYTGALYQALGETFPNDDFHLLTDQGNRALSHLDRRWWLIGLPRHLRKIRADVFHGTDYSVPYFPVCPTVMTVHDLSPWMDPNWHHGAARIRRRTPVLLRLGLATMILTDCQAVRSAVIERFHLPAERVVSVPLAADPRFVPTSLPTSEPYFLYLGTLEPRKNLPTLVEAWKIIYARHKVRPSGEWLLRRSMN